MDNITLSKLRENISKYEMSSFLLRQRLGLEGVLGNSGVKQDSNLEQKVDSLTQMVMQLQVSQAGMRKGDAPQNYYRPDYNGYEYQGRMEDDRQDVRRGRSRDWESRHYERDHSRGRRDVRARSRDRREQSRDRTGRSGSRQWEQRNNFRRDSRSQERQKGRRNIRWEDSGKCFRCGTYGHFAKECRYAKN